MRTTILCCASLLTVLATAGESPRPVARAASVAHPTPVAGMGAVTRLVGPGMDVPTAIACGIDGLRGFGHGIKSFGETTDWYAFGIAADGAITWAKSYGGTHKDALESVAAFADGGFVLVGDSQSLFFSDLKAVSPQRPARPLVARLRSDGSVAWAFTVDRVAQLDGALALADGGALLHGYAEPKGRNQPYRALVVRVDPLGTLVWARAYELKDTTLGSAELVANGDGALLLATANTAQGYRPVAIALGLDGALRWAKRYDGGVGAFDSAIADPAGGTFVVASADADGRYSAVVALGANGAPRWATHHVAGLNVAWRGLALEGESLVVAGSAYELEGTYESALVLRLARSDGTRRTSTGFPAGELVGWKGVCNGPTGTWLLGGGTGRDREAYAQGQFDLLWGRLEAGDGREPSLAATPLTLTTADLQLKAATLELELVDVKAKLEVRDLAPER